MNAGKTHLIVSLQPRRLKAVAAQLNMQAISAWQGKPTSQELATLSTEAKTELTGLLQVYEDALQRHAAKLVWEEEYVEEGV